jgi:predicted deacetylase
MGDEVALHGFTHRDRGAPRGWVDGLRRRHYTLGEGEFSALPRAVAARRIAAGLRWLQRLGLPAAGFVAPAWLLSDGSWQAVRDQPLAYTCTLRKIHLLPRGEVAAAAQSQVYSCRSAWRRVASVAWNRLLARAQSHAAHVRIELHPPDAEHALVRHCWQRLLRRQLQVREPITLAALARRRGASDLSEQQLHQLRRREADGAADDDVARVVQAQHDA